VRVVDSTYRLYGLEAGNIIAAFNWDNLRIANNARYKGRVLGLADRVDLLPVEPNLRGGRTSSGKISNEYKPISGMRYLIHFYESSFIGIWECICLMREE